MNHLENLNFGYIPIIAEWKSYLNSDRKIVFNQLCFGSLQLVLFYKDPKVRYGEPSFKVRGLIFNIKKDLGCYQTEDEAIQVCYNVAKHLVTKIQDGKKSLIFTN